MNEKPVMALVGFVRSIAVLALPADGQIRWLNSLGLPGGAAIADELAQEFGDGCLLLAQFVEHGWISERLAKKLRGLDTLLGVMSGPEKAEIWEVSALESAAEWIEVRKRALEILVDL
ncbi:hypothetical protein [Amycolatopsis samaneae]|uniref:Uncharacterized protein n=1 Tax=Amycolatopsis samaneae TaxID=664691 RepID=A0ABW5G906_9PSEU